MCNIHFRRKFENHLLILKAAFPIILANASAPLLGLSDTAVIGQTGTAVELGGIALGALIFSFAYWGFGFLRMGTTGFVAQAAGVKNMHEVQVILLRSLLMAVVIAVVLLFLQFPIAWFALWLMDASEAVKAHVKVYFDTRIWGAPATLATFALLGTLIGLGHTKKLLVIQLFLNGMNIVLNLFFVLILNWGVKGIALGTVIAEWLAFGFAFCLVLQSVQSGNFVSMLRNSWTKLLDKGKLWTMLTVNSNIMLRTLALLIGFAWFANEGAKFGNTVLAANHILLQFVSLSAFFLDGYAYVVEMLTGQAIGIRNPHKLKRDIRDSTQLAGITAILLAMLIWLYGDLGIRFLTVERTLQFVSHEFLIYAAMYVAVSFIAFQLDGIFIGATRSKEMRNAAIVSLLLFLGAGYWLIPLYHNHGLWLAFIIYVVARGISLGFYFPKIMKEINDLRLQ